MIQVTRKYRFSASHRLHSSQLSESENLELYGKCHNPFGHGHNYELEVSVSGPVDERSGRAVDPGRLDRVVVDNVIKPFDQHDLNTEVDAFQQTVPTTENLGREVFDRLAGAWHTAFPGPWPVLEKIRITETPRNFFEVARTDAPA
jgi:6-pyruvoyltetrahydropterin/6-carboxytetrahydropterin synthase